MKNCQKKFASSKKVSTFAVPFEKRPLLRGFSGVSSLTYWERKHEEKKQSTERESLWRPRERSRSNKKKFFLQVARRLQFHREPLGKKARANGGCLGYPEAKKDVVSCEKSRGSANRTWSANIRMGQPTQLKAVYQLWNWGEPGELKHLSTRRKRKKRRYPE